MQCSPRTQTIQSQTDATVQNFTYVYLFLDTRIDYAGRFVSIPFR